MNSNELLIGKYKLEKKVLFLIFIEVFLIVINNISKIKIDFFLFDLLRFYPFLVIFYILLLNIPLYKSNFQYTLIYNFFLLLFNDLLVRLFYYNKDCDDCTNYTLTMIFLLTLIIGSFIMFIYSFMFNKKNILKNIAILAIGIICSCVIYYFINSSILLGNKVGENLLYETLWLKNYC